MKQNYTYQRTITAEEIADLVETALAGITYWADGARFGEGSEQPYPLSQALLHDNTVEIHDAETGRWHTLTLQKLLNTLTLRRRFDPQNFDMEDGDIIVQYAIFGSRVYA